LSHVWLEHSNDGGATWIVGNNGQPLDGNSSGAKNPSIAFTYQDFGYGDENYYIGIVWQEKYGNLYRIKGKMCSQMSGGNGIPQHFTSTTTLYTETREPYSSYNANPNLCLSGGMAGPYLFSIEKKATSGSYSQGINWFVGHIDDVGSQVSGPFYNPEDHGLITGTNVSTTCAQLYVDEYGSETIGVNFVYQQGTYSGGIYSGSLYFNYSGGNWSLTEYNDGLISYPSANISPSIVTLPTYLYAACWIEYETLTYYLFGNSSIDYYDSGVRSCSINQGGNGTSGFIAWSSQNYSGTWYNKSMRFDDGEPVSGTAGTLNTSGKYIQLGNGAGTDLTNMRVSSFYPFISPYYFNTSAALGPLSKSSSELVTGRGFMIQNGDATFNYRFEGLNVDGQNINFVDVSDTMNFGKIDNLNNALITEPFLLNDNSEVVFTERSGFADSVAAAKSFGKNDYICYKVELIDDATGKVVGSIRNKTIDADNPSSFRTNSFRLNTKGLPDITVRAKITVETNCIREISTKANPKGDIPTGINPARINVKRSNLLLTKSFMNENEALGKSVNEQLNLIDLEMPSAYELSQNYPNPFNPTTTIKYSIPNSGLVTLKVYDILGKEVATLVNGKKQAGKYSVVFNGANLATGTYIVRMHSEDFSKTIKILLIK
jgi:Secretion system C-terminal sorting domain